MPNVDVPGVGVVEFPDSMSQQDISAALRKISPPPRQPNSPAETAAVAFGERLLDGVSGVANLGIGGVERAANLYRSPVGKATPNRPSPIRPGSPLDQMQQSPVRLPRVADGEIIAALAGSPIQAALSGASMLDLAMGEGMGEAFEGNLAARRQMAADNPMTDTVAGFGADALSLLLGRTPLNDMARGAGFTARMGAASDNVARLASPTSSGVFDRAIASGINRVQNAWSAPRSTPMQRTLAYAADSPFVRNLAKGAGRSLETGIEGAALSAIQEGDPFEVAGMAAGGQAMASLTSEALEDITGAVTGKGGFSSRAVNLSVAALAAAGAWQLLQSAVPGGEDNPLDAVEGGFNKVLFGIAVGVASEAVGRRASGEGILREFPAFADALQTIPRTTLIQAGMAISNDDVVKQASQNAHALGASDAKLYMDAMTSEDPSAAIRELLESNPRMRRILTAPDPRLANVPEMEN